MEYIGSLIAIFSCTRHQATVSAPSADIKRGATAKATAHKKLASFQLPKNLPCSCMFHMQLSWPNRISRIYIAYRDIQECLCVCACIHILYIYVCVYTCVCTYTYTYTYTSTSTSTSTSTYTYTYTYTYQLVYVYTKYTNVVCIIQGFFLLIHHLVLQMLKWKTNVQPLKMDKGKDRKSQ